MLQVHQRLADFEIVRLLGKGGMGEVYEAQQLNPPRRVALKVVVPWLAANDQALERFWREAAVPAQLDHPSIVRIFTMGKTDDGVAYYTMQLVRGISLAALMARATAQDAAVTVPPPTVSEAVPGVETPSQAGPPPSLFLPPPPEAPVEVPSAVSEYRSDRFRMTARLGVLAARALADAHRRGFLHRDIKPSNLMIDLHGHLYLLDFGLSRGIDPGAFGTHSGGIVGTPWFMSPEQARGEQIDHRSDLYSLGVTLYQLATAGMGPFTADKDNSNAVLSQVRAGSHLPVRALTPHIPRDLERIVTRAIQPKPARRYQSGEELAADLEQFLAGLPPSKPSRTAPVARRRSRRWPWAVGLSLVATLAAAVVLYGKFSRPEQPPAGPGGPAAVQAPADDSPPYPELLRQRKYRVRQDLLSQDFEPVYYRRLAGDGTFRRTPFQLMMVTPVGGDPTLIALDDDPERRWFEFATDVDVPLNGPAGSRGGIFFGWHKNSERFFVAEVDERPVGSFPHGRVMVGMMRVIKGKGAEGDVCDVLPLPLDKGTVPLAKSKSWHYLAVRAVDDTITITVDGEKTCFFSMEWLTANDPTGITAGLNPRGALGIWAQGGNFISFRNASIMALPVAAGSGK